MKRHLELRWSFGVISSIAIMAIVRVCEYQAWLARFLQNIGWESVNLGWRTLLPPCFIHPTHRDHRNQSHTRTHHDLGQEQNFTFNLNFSWKFVPATEKFCGLELIIWLELNLIMRSERQINFWSKQNIVKQFPPVK